MHEYRRSKTVLLEGEVKCSQCGAIVQTSHIARVVRRTVYRDGVAVTEEGILKGTTCPLCGNRIALPMLVNARHN